MWLTRKVTPVQSSDWAGRTFLGECLALICKRNKEISFEAAEIGFDRRGELPIDMEESPYYLTVLPFCSHVIDAILRKKK